MKVPKAVLDAYMIVDNIAFYYVPKSKPMAFNVVDLRYPKYKCRLLFNKVNNKFSEKDSTFKDGKRKYQMLYYQERNRELLLNAAEHYNTLQNEKKQRLSGK